MVKISKEIGELLEIKAAQYNHPTFIEHDPIAIPHQFTAKEDIEIAAFITATIAWGTRKGILNSAHRIMDALQQAPYQFVMQHQPQDLKPLYSLVHRTFNGRDLVYFISALRQIYQQHGGLEAALATRTGESSVYPALLRFRQIFLSLPHEPRLEKHLSNPAKNSACKRLNMFLRWMVRRDKHGVDFGLWKSISPAQLSCPLDVHSSKVARELGLLKRSINDLKAVQELDNALRQLDPADPVKYDYALFGLGVFEKFGSAAHLRN